MYDMSKTQKFGTMRPLKIIIAVALLLCLFPLPYGYYELVRLGGMVCFAVLAYRSYQQKQEEWTVAYAALALLFPVFLFCATQDRFYGQLDTVLSRRVIF